MATKTKTIIIGVICVTGSADIGLASVQFLNNGGFETNGFDSDGTVVTELDFAISDTETSDSETTSPSASGWSFSGPAGLLKGNTTEGEYAAMITSRLSFSPDIYSRGSVSQTFGLAESGDYVLCFESFRTAAFFEVDAAFEVYITETTSGTATLLGSFYEIHEGAFSGIGGRISGTATLREIELTLDSGSYALEFVHSGPRAMPGVSVAVTAGEIYLDNIRLTAIPEPSATVLCIIAMGMFCRRRRLSSN